MILLRASRWFCCVLLDGSVACFQMVLLCVSRWFCLVDDDTYVIVPSLLKLLDKYDWREDHYIGKPSLSIWTTSVNKHTNQVRAPHLVSTTATSVLYTGSHRLYSTTHQPGTYYPPRVYHRNLSIGYGVSPIVLYHTPTRYVLPASCLPPLPQYQIRGLTDCTLPHTNQVRTTRLVSTTATSVSDTGSHRLCSTAHQPGTYYPPRVYHRYLSIRYGVSPIVLYRTPTRYVLPASCLPPLPQYRTWGLTNCTLLSMHYLQSTRYRFATGGAGICFSRELALRLRPHIA